MRDGRVDVLESGCGVKNIVTIDTHRHALWGAGATAPPSRESPRHLYSRRSESVIVGYTL